jgi:ubiquitin-like protein Pup
MSQAVKKVARTKQQTEAAVKTKPKETKPGKELVDEIDQMLEEIDEVLDEVAGGNSSEYAQDFVKSYVQKGGE